MILAGDVGGTNARLAFFRERHGELVSVASATYRSQKYDSLDQILLDFTSNHGLSAEYVCLGVAGPVQDGQCKTSNLPWVVDAKVLAKELQNENVGLINDLEATAYGISVVPQADVVTLSEGSPNADGNRAVLAAGTGLGEAGLFWDGQTHTPFACEGGHSDFSPRDETEIQLLRYLLDKYGHASWERVLSGPGLVNIYDFLWQEDSEAGSDAVYGEVRSNGAPAISDAALSDRCPVCRKALSLFVSLYGAEAGNLALKLLATGGVYVAGGIAGQIVPELSSGRFRDAFVAKGRMQPILEAIPLFVITTDRAALLGAAEYARRALVAPER